MALHVKNRDAAYYQSADYYRNSVPLNYRNNRHYFARLPGRKRVAFIAVSSRDIANGWMHAASATM